MICRQFNTLFCLFISSLLVAGCLEVNNESSGHSITWSRNFRVIGLSAFGLQGDSASEQGAELVNESWVFSDIDAISPQANGLEGVWTQTVEGDAEIKTGRLELRCEKPEGESTALEFANDGESITLWADLFDENDEPMVSYRLSYEFDSLRMIEVFSPVGVGYEIEQENSLVKLTSTSSRGAVSSFANFICK
jgi:hypothetical protein